MLYLGYPFTKQGGPLSRNNIKNNNWDGSVPWSDPNGNFWIKVFVAGPKPRAPDHSVTYRMVELMHMIQLYFKNKPQSFIRNDAWTETSIHSFSKCRLQLVKWPKFKWTDTCFVACRLHELLQVISSGSLHFVMQLSVKSSFLFFRNTCQHMHWCSSPSALLWFIGSSSGTRFIQE